MGGGDPVGFGDHIVSGDMACGAPVVRPCYGRRDPMGGDHGLRRPGGRRRPFGRRRSLGRRRFELMGGGERMGSGEANPWAPAVHRQRRSRGLRRLRGRRRSHGRGPIPQAAAIRRVPMGSPFCANVGRNTAETDMSTLGRARSNCQRCQTISANSARNWGRLRWRVGRLRPKSAKSCLPTAKSYRVRPKLDWKDQDSPRVHQLSWSRPD